ncbi:MAG: di-trans,poly-cis-decaprenylcistransferase [Gemmatimonadaceae bacterium]|nr:di-trans,poly-cis-decaprenylcistransferase [Gemmatimonadaceae bacterium]
MRSDAEDSARAARIPRHIAIIMDGNGRWANQRGKPRTFGHLAGARTVRQIVEHSRRTGVRCLTLYAFSSDNWSRPQDEVAALMRLFRRHLAAETPRCVENDVRISVVGRRDRLSPELVTAIRAAEEATQECAALHLRLAVDYSARDTMVRAASACGGRQPSREAFAALLASVNHDDGSAGDVDLLIRTGGEQRLSDFLLWECAYAELVFSRRMWPEFGTADFDAAIEDFHGRDRRFGGLSKAI